MKILFTKIINPKHLAEALPTEYTASCIETLEIRYKKIPKFDLKRNSIIFTSTHGVKSFFDNGFKPNEDCTAKNYNKIYCVGETTKKEIRKNGFGTFKVMRNAKELSEFIIDKCPSESFIHFCGDIALDVLNDALPLQNVGYKKVVVYETIEKHPIYKHDFDAVVFFSPSGVRSFAKHNNFKEKLIFSIGETTSKEIRNYTHNNIITSQENTLNDVLKLIKDYSSLQ